MEAFFTDHQQQIATNQGDLSSKDLMPRNIMSSEPKHWMVFGQLVMAVQCFAEASPAAAGASAQHCTGMIN